MPSADAGPHWGPIRPNERVHAQAEAWRLVPHVIIYALFFERIAGGQNLIGDGPQLDRREKVVSDSSSSTEKTIMR